MIVNVTAPDEGDVLVKGSTSRPTSTIHRYLPEERGLYKKMKVGEQLLFFANLKGLNPPKPEEVDQWLERLEMSE